VVVVALARPAPGSSSSPLLSTPTGGWLLKRAGGHGQAGNSGPAHRLSVPRICSRAGTKLVLRRDASPPASRLPAPAASFSSLLLLSIKRGPPSPTPFPHRRRRAAKRHLEPPSACADRSQETAFSDIRLSSTLPLLRSSSTATTTTDPPIPSSHEAAPAAAVPHGGGGGGVQRGRRCGGAAQQQGRREQEAQEEEGGVRAGGPRARVRGRGGRPRGALRRARRAAGRAALRRAPPPRRAGVRLRAPRRAPHPLPRRRLPPPPAPPLPRPRARRRTLRLRLGAVRPYFVLSAAAGDRLRFRGFSPTTRGRQDGALLFIFPLFLRLASVVAVLAVAARWKNYSRVSYFFTPFWF
uniref:Uncharacterized protein n=1 Tax=Zea mays TaxID=4577 RepID=A0A804PF68_MAIZE